MSLWVLWMCLALAYALLVAIRQLREVPGSQEGKRGLSSAEKSSLAEMKEGLARSSWNPKCLAWKTDLADIISSRRLPSQAKAKVKNLQKEVDRCIERLELVIEEVITFFAPFASQVLLPDHDEDVDRMFAQLQVLASELPPSPQRLRLSETTWGEFRHWARRSELVRSHITSLDVVMKSSVAQLKAFEEELQLFLNTADDDSGIALAAAIRRLLSLTKSLHVISDCQETESVSWERTTDLVNRGHRELTQFQLLALSYGGMVAQGLPVVSEQQALDSIEEMVQAVDDGLLTASKEMSEELVQMCLQWFFLIQMHVALIRSDHSKVPNSPELIAKGLKAAYSLKKVLAPHLPVFAAETVLGGVELMSVEDVQRLLGSLNSSSRKARIAALAKQYASLARRLGLWDLYMPFMAAETARSFLDAKNRVKLVISHLLDD